MFVVVVQLLGLSAMRPRPRATTGIKGVSILEVRWVCVFLDMEGVVGGFVGRAISSVSIARGRGVGS